MKIGILVALSALLYCSPAVRAAEPGTAVKGAMVRSADEPKAVQCFSWGASKAACDTGVIKVSPALFAKEFPGGKAFIHISTQLIIPKNLGRGIVIAGELQVVETVSDGKRTGMKPLYKTMASWDTDNLEGGLPTQEEAAKLMGGIMINILNEQMSRGIP